MKDTKNIPRFIDTTYRHNIQTRHLEMMGLTKYSLLIADFNWYGQNQDEIEAWCKKNIPNTWRNGMMILFGTEQEKLIFLLRWADA